MRKEQQLQELIGKKERLEKLIANILNNDNEVFSKLKHIIKENVKAVLSENKQVISISFTALIQTLKSDPQMINVIYNILTANDGEQHEDNNNNNNITKYLESNKDSILDLAKKNYENLVDSLTNYSIADASSNSTLSLPLSSTFSTLPNQSDIYRIEKSENYHNNQGDIAE